ncbi:MAG: STAS domain-containing protein [Candidatus Gracilibacteria bacterium]|nr:STAS domain-containing protein [Candidatus Gracilibacteria bacterium]
MSERNFKLKIEEDLITVSFPENICDGEAASELREIIAEIASRSRLKGVIFNVNGITYIDSVGTGQLVKAFTNFSKLGKKLVFTASPESKIRQILNFFRLDSTFSIVETVDEARDAIKHIFEAQAGFYDGNYNRKFGSRGQEDPECSDKSFRKSNGKGRYKIT